MHPELPSRESRSQGRSLVLGSLSQARLYLFPAKSSPRDGSAPTVRLAQASNELRCPTSRPADPATNPAGPKPLAERKPAWLAPRIQTPCSRLPCHLYPPRKYIAFSGGRFVPGVDLLHNKNWESIKWIKSSNGFPGCKFGLGADLLHTSPCAWLPCASPAGSICDCGTDRAESPVRESCSHAPSAPRSVTVAQCPAVCDSAPAVTLTFGTGNLVPVGLSPRVARRSPAYRARGYHIAPGDLG